MLKLIIYEQRRKDEWFSAELGQHAPLWLGMGLPGGVCRRIGPDGRRTSENMAKSVFSDLKRFGYSTDTRDQPEQETTSPVDGDATHPSKTPSRGSATSQQVHPRQGNTRRWGDTVESWRAR